MDRRDRREPFHLARPDLRFARSGDTSSVAYGLLPASLFNAMRDKFIAAVKARKAGAVSRTP
ncbi:MAG TPA: hypothetical protein VHZ26_16440 [Caulobacteraceae bacterium]|nr:hypothetical protein [Caulobacteraceae bacterium]